MLDMPLRRVGIDKWKMVIKSSKRIKGENKNVKRRYEKEIDICRKELLTSKSLFGVDTFN